MLPRGEVFGRYLGHEGEPMNGISDLVRIDAREMIFLSTIGGCGKKASIYDPRSGLSHQEPHHLAP